jgi:formylglycine-generating enzyme required for sulfatase activity
MRRSRLLGTLVLSGLVTLAIFAAGGGCSSTDPHPSAGTTGIDGGGGGVDAGKDNAIPQFDANFDAIGDDGGGNGCNNKFKDGEETDVDCGGSVCKKCVDGQACIKPTDCGGGSCIANVCKTVTCTNGITDGDETDVDCGGKSCPKCTIGKRCKVLDDCGSATCDTGTNACACPPNMAIVAKASGGAYCIDSAEVSKGQYNKFITANVPVTTQPAICSSNATFVPRGAWPPATAEDPTPNMSGLQFTFSLPVHYVDWCDAYSYCKWAGKQLCGEINRQGLDPTQRNDAGASAWYNACSAQGVKPWPYGVTFTPELCNSTGLGEIGTNASGCVAYPSAQFPAASCNCPTPATPANSTGCGYGAPGVFQDESEYIVVGSDVAGNISSYVHTSCQGGSTGLYQMSGNLAEWEDSCTDAGAEAGASQNCGLRGGSYAAAGDPTALSCAAARELARMPAAGAPDPLADVGIRCCVY